MAFFHNSRPISGQASLLYNIGCAGNPATSAKVLSKTPLLSGLSDREFDFLLERVASRKYFPRARLYSVKANRAQVRLWLSQAVFGSSRALPADQNRYSAFEGPGGSFAETPVFDGGHYPASVVAVEEPVLLFVGKHDFRALCLAHPAVALKLFVGS